MRRLSCHVEAVETAIWRTEVAPKSKEGKRLLDHLDRANRDANPELMRLALKLATGAGKTTVMAMLIAWQTVNAVRRPGSKNFSKGFLIVAPGLTIRDRLRVLQPNDPDSYYNALDYHDPLPNGNQEVACRVEQAIHPFLMQRNLLRVSMRTAATGRSQKTPLRLTLLLDNSGSMERPDRRQAVLRAFQTLTQQLIATDQITLIRFASTPRLLADKVPGNQGETLMQLIETLPSEGGTNIEAALLLAREKAAEQQLAGAQNRIVLMTDGAVNLGDANPESLAKLVTQMRDAGIAFEAAGISAQDLNDQVLEALTRQGDGRYYLLDSA